MNSSDQAGKKAEYRARRAAPQPGPKTEAVKIEPYEMGAGDKGLRKTHPAFGMAHFLRRSSGGDSTFFGSGVKNIDQVFSLRIVKGSQVWNLHESRFFGDSTPIIEVDFTAAQFVQLLTTMNQGSGVPCTIRRAHLEAHEKQGPDVIPGIVDPTSEHDLIRADLKEAAKTVVEDLAATIDQLSTSLAESGLSKKKQEETLRKIQRVKMQVESNLPFIVEQYQRTLDHQKTQHVAEVDAAITGMIQNLGMKSLAQLLELNRPTDGAASDQPTLDATGSGGE